MSSLHRASLSVTSHTHTKSLSFFFFIIPGLPCLPYPSNFVCSLFVLDQQVPFTVPVHSEMCGIQWKMFGLSGSIAGKETDSVAFGSCHLSIAPLLVVQLHFHPSPFHSCILSGSSLCGSYHAIAAPCELMCAAALLCLRNTHFLNHSLPLGLTIFSASLLQ